MSNGPETFILDWDDLSTTPATGTTKGVSWPEVESTLRRLCQSDSGFVILARAGDDLHYCQTARTQGARPEVIVEWQDGSTDRHYMLSKTLEQPDLLVELFRVYYHTSHLIAGAAEWMRIDLKSPASPSSADIHTHREISTWYPPSDG